MSCGRGRRGAAGPGTRRWGAAATPRCPSRRGPRGAPAGARPGARRLARVIVKRRARARFAVSDDLVNAIRETLGPRSGPADFARIFQALRIVVNQELEQIELALPALRAALQPGGRLGVISYHSGEDRIVKRAFRDWSKTCVCPPRQPVCTCRGRALGRVLTQKAQRPAAGELRAHPRARTARFRAFEVNGEA